MKTEPAVASGRTQIMSAQLRSLIASFRHLMRSSCWSLNRLLSIAITLAGFCALLLSSRSVWFYVPVANSGGVASPHDIVQMVPQVTFVFQGAMLAGGIVLGCSLLYFRQWNMASTIIATVLIFVGLVYPYFVMMRSPVESAEAAWLQSQFDGLLWLGGDIHNNAEFAQAGWKSKVYLIDPARQLSVVPLPSWSPWEVGLNRVGDLLLWLGYSNAFCQFVRRGWTLAVLGSSLLLIVSLKTNDQLVFRRAGVALGLFTLLSCCAVFGAWTMPFQASRHVRLASELMSAHRYSDSLRELERAVVLLPALAEDTHYVAQRGVLDEKIKADTPFAKLRRASVLESQGRYDQAYDRFEPLIRSPIPAVRRESLRAIMRFAVHDYNSGRFELARRRFELSLRHQPCNVKLIYFSQIVGIRESRVDQVDLLCDWMYQATDHFGFESKKVLRAASQQHRTVTAAMTHDSNRMWAALEKAKRP